jgi:hypothetical protein
MKGHQFVRTGGRFGRREDLGVLASGSQDAGKASCYADEADRRRADAHTEDLDLETILAKLEAALRSRGRLEGPRPPDKEWALRRVAVYIRFPASEAA